MPPTVRRAFCFAGAFGFAALACLASASADASVLDAIRARGHVLCGVGDGPKGYSSVNSQGAWSGISVDFCRALAAAVLGNRETVQFRELSEAERFAALQSGEVDVLSRNLVMTSSLDTTQGIRFPGVLVYDGQGFLVRKGQNVTSALELSGARICITTETADAQGVTDFFNGLKLPFDLQKFEKWADAKTAYATKSCQVLSANLSALASARQLLPDGSEHIILPELASKQLVGPAVRQGDDDWFSVVRWTIYALIAAEEFGINSGNVDTIKGSATGEVRRFLDLDLGKRLGLSPDWTQRVIKQVGNYGELFDRHLGIKSSLKLERRLNNLASNGGLHYAPSFR
ncbi:MAG TPA: amino acid ABC transporter substrate-binding protein [Hyphomicrobiaceae bacterium]|nr:amino acid ABC transporter substrate-binding protein [Hyphomicrobiaceae bacterium]